MYMFWVQMQLNEDENVAQNSFALFSICGFKPTLQVHQKIWKLWNRRVIKYGELR